MVGQGLKHERTSIVMNTIQKTIIVVVAAGAAGIGLYKATHISNRHIPAQALEPQAEQLAGLSNQVQELQRERDRATNALAAVVSENAALKKNPSDVLKLRGEVGRLQQENMSIGSSSALSKVTANPESRKMLRDQQKMGMSRIYKGLAQELKLSSEQTDKLNDLLADHVMGNVDQITTALRDKLAPEQMNRLFDGQEAALQAQVQALLGPDGLAQYQDYTKNLLSTLTADQFKSMLSGDDAARGAKAKELSQVLQEEVQAALNSAGLPADYQTVPILNFRNIASEQEGDKSLKLLDDIYQRAAARSGSFLSAAEQAKFQEFRTTAINNNRAALALNHTMMAPISK
jgi:hypothetical protein